MIQFEVTDHLGARQGRIVDNGTMFNGQLAPPADPPVMSFPGVDGVRPPTVAGRVAALVRQIPMIAWALGLCAGLLAVAWGVALG